MANIVYLTIKEERRLDFDLNPIKGEETKKTVYINCDEISCFLGEFNNKEELEEIIGEENILDYIENNLSGYELESIMPILEVNDYTYQLGYYPCYELRTAKTEHLENKCE